MLLALACLLVATPALAQRVEGERAVADSLYAGEVPVRNQNEGERRAGFARDGIRQRGAFWRAL